ncbi:hypothetical protein [Endozoicomonas sp. SESOKO1]|uniref:hypothetical protein n=1 Tax=Endozoicomonas sp. SESOKO1 TaxID=2828742 RepID=UPI00214775E2|nr:hypothetical protein [Endozoicomonas sp. SESOKO1]
MKHKYDDDFLKGMYEGFDDMEPESDDDGIACIETTKKISAPVNSIIDLKMKLKRIKDKESEKKLLAKVKEGLTPNKAEMINSIDALIEFLSDMPEPKKQVVIDFFKGGVK